jgi:hypothetical protein
VFHNAKFDLHVLARAFKIPQADIDNTNIVDTLIAAWMLSPGQSGLGLDNQVMQRLQHEMIPIENLIGRGKNQITFNRAPIKDATEYGAEDAVYTLRLWEPLKKELEKAGVTFNPGQPAAGIVGAAGALLGLGQMNGIDSFCLMGETSGYFADSRSAINVVAVLKKILKLRKVDTKALAEDAKKLDELMNQAAQQAEAPQERDELSYIG